jgi:uncharacterized membrane protein
VIGVLPHLAFQTDTGRVRLSRILLAAILVPAVAGMGVSAYLAFTHYAGLPVYCTGAGGCHTVQSSAYATLLSLPVALLGFALYALIVVSTITAIGGTGQLSRLAPFAVFTLALSGTLYSAYLTWLELYRIYAVCVWCVTSASLLASILFLSIAELLASGRWREGLAAMDG